MLRTRGLVLQQGPLIFVVLGAASFAVGAVLLIVFPTSGAGVDFHPIHIDSTIYLCHGIQLGPLSSEQGERLISSITGRYEQAVWPCFTDNGTNALLLQTYYPRILIAVLVAAASVFGSAEVVLTIPVIVAVALGGIWGWIVALPTARPTWLRLFVLFLPALSFAWVLWLGSLMTEGLYVLILLIAILLVWMQERGRISEIWYPIGLLVCGALLLATRSSWPIAGVLWGFALESIFVGHLGKVRPVFSGQLPRFAIFVLSQGIGVVSALIASRVFEGLVTPQVDFPPSNEPPTSIPVNPTELFFVLRVSLDSLVVGIQQSIDLTDPVSILLVVSMPVLIIWVLIQAPWRMTYFVFVNWLFSMAIVGVVSLCCGGLNSFFRYQIPAMFVTLAVAWLADTFSRTSQPWPFRKNAAVENGGRLKA